MTIIHIPDREFVRIVKATALAAPLKNDAYNKPWRGVNITITANGGLELAATDRYRLARLRTTEGWGEPEPAKIAHFAEYDGLMKFVSLVKPHRTKKADVILESTGIALTASWGAWTVTLPLLDTDFPNTAKAIDVDLSHVEPSEVVKYNPTFMAAGAQACSLMSNTHLHNTLKVTTHGHSKQSLLEPDECLPWYEFLYLLMPVRFNG